MLYLFFLLVNLSFQFYYSRDSDLSNIRQDKSQSQDQHQDYRCIGHPKWTARSNGRLGAHSGNDVIADPQVRRQVTVGSHSR